MGKRRQGVSTCKDQDDVEVLKLKLDVAELRASFMESQKQIETLKEVIDQQSTIIKENTTLLRKQRLPPRPYMNSTSKALIAQSQNWTCSNPGGDCPLFKLGDGRFGKSLFEIDHVLMWSKSGKHSGNIRAICAFCHACVTRQQIAQQGDIESDHESQCSEDIAKG